MVMDKTTELLSISKVLEKITDHTTNEIFDTYRDKLLLEGITYVIPAVWGVVKEGELDETQKEIHKKTQKLVEDSLSALFIKEISAPQAFAIRYLVNRTIIFSISYMIEMTKAKVCEGTINTNQMLANMEPTGHA
jgi:hypothetical protein